VCVSAIHPLEIAAALEADGMSDRVAQSRYGYADVFSVAEELFLRIPRRPSDPSSQREDEPAGRFLARGLGFVIPSGLLVGLSRELNLTAFVGIMVLALFIPWSGMQVVAYLDTRLRGREEDSAAARIVATGAVAIVVAVATLAVFASPSGRPEGVMVAFGQSLYFVSATVLLSRHREWLLVMLVAPAALFLVAVDAGAMTYAVLVAVVVTVAVAAARTLRAGWRTRSPAAVSRGEMRTALAHGAVGFCWAGASFLGMLTAPSLPTIVASALPVTLMLGLAERQVSFFDARVVGLLERRVDRRGFRSAALVELTLAFLPYLAGMMVSAAVAAGVAAGMGYDIRVVTVVSYILLGVGFFGGLVITVRHNPVVALVASAPAGVTLLLVGGVDDGRVTPTAYLAATAVFAVGLMLAAAASSSHPLDHRAVLR